MKRQCDSRSRLNVDKHDRGPMDLVASFRIVLLSSRLQSTRRVLKVSRDECVSKSRYIVEVPSANVYAVLRAKTGPMTTTLLAHDQYV